MARARTRTLAALVAVVAVGHPPAAVAQGRVLLEEDFEEPSELWPPFSDGAITLENRRGGLRVFLESTEALVLPAEVTEPLLHLRVEADVTRLAKGEEAGLYGVGCGLGSGSDGSQYTFSISPETRYYQAEWLGPSQVETLGRGFGAKAIRRPPATNHVQADCQGGPDSTVLRLSVNGKLVAELTDEHASTASFDSVVLAAAAPGTDVLFDNVVVAGYGSPVPAEAAPTEPEAEPGAAEEPADQVDCTSKVVDDADALSAEMEAQAADAAARLERIGADPYVRFVGSFAPSASIDAYEQELVRACSTYHSQTPGERKNNLVLLIVALDERRAVLAWGERWDAALEDEADRIRADFLNPNLRDGEYGLAAAETLDEVASGIDAELHPSRSPWWLVLYALAGLAILGAAGFAAWRYRRAVGRRAATRKLAIDARTEAASAIAEVGTAHDELGRALEIAALAVGPEEASELDDRSEKATAAVEKATELYSALHGPNWDPDRRHSTDELEKIAAAYGAASQAAGLAQAEIAAATELTSELTELSERLPADIEAADVLLATAVTARESAGKARYRVVTADDLSARAAGLLAEARAAGAQKRVRAGAAAASEAKALAQEARDWCYGLPELRAGLEKDAEALEGRISDVSAKTPGAAQVFELVSAAFAEDSWRPVRGNGSAAEQRIAFAAHAREEAVAAATMERQNWEASRAAIESGDAALDEAEKRLEAIHAMRDALERAKADAPQEVEAAAADIAAAWEFVGSHDDEIAEAREDELRAAEGTLEQARAELAEEMPNYLVAVKQAAAANEAADRVLAACRSEVEEVERLEAKAASALRDADFAVSTAAGYLDSHARPQTWLDEAQEALAEAQRSSGTQEPEKRKALETRIELARKAESEAKRVLDEAKRKVRADKDEDDRPFWPWLIPVGEDWDHDSSGGGGWSGGDSGGGGGGSDGGGGGSSSGGW